MPLFFRTTVIRDAIDRLVAADVQRGFTDFLILKRALKRVGKDTVPFSMKDPNFTGAIHEVAGTQANTKGKSKDNPALAPFFKVFGIAQAVSRKMLTNGPADTLSGPNWQRVVRLEGQRPRRGGLTEGYEAHLEALLLKGDKNKPSLIDAAIWYYRASDLETQLQATGQKHTDIQTTISKAFIDDLGLTPGEISRIFDPRTGATIALALSTACQAAPADPMTYLPTNTSETSEAPNGIDQMAEAFCKDATDDAVGMQLPAGIPNRFVAALLSKRFVILTGLSGSGKTKLAQAFAIWLCPEHKEGACSQYIVQAVGSDWTNREPLLGYPDALSPGEYRLPASGVLQLILSAMTNPKQPFFVILDEMNLSHVERYFADALSAMEAGQHIPLHEHQTPAGKDWSGVPSEIELPSNLFVVGTVNVDETTYMFSPKVLDRANVIEFRVSEKEMGEFLDHPKSVDLSQLTGKGQGYAEAFVLQAGRLDASADELPEDAKTETRSVMASLFAALAAVGSEFGYRTVYEIHRFVFFHNSVSGATWKLDDALDAAIMQKVLPKLHGSKTKLTPVLTALKQIVIKGRFPISSAKIERMELRLKQNGFTSYAED